MWDSPEQDSIQPVIDACSVVKWKLYCMKVLLFNGLEVNHKTENLIQHKKLNKKNIQGNLQKQPSKWKQDAYLIIDNAIPHWFGWWEFE